MNKHRGKHFSKKFWIFFLTLLVLGAILTPPIYRYVQYSRAYKKSDFVVLPSSWNNGGSLSFSEDASLLAIALQPKGTLIWDLQKGEPVQFFSGPEASYLCNLSPDGKYLSQSSPYHLRILDCNSGEVVWQQTGEAVELSSNWKYISRLKNNNIEIFENTNSDDMITFKKVSSFSPKLSTYPEEPISRVILLPDGKSIPLYNTQFYEESHSKIFDLEGHVVQRIPWITEQMSGGFIALSQNGQWLAHLNFNNKSLNVFNLKESKSTPLLKIEPIPIATKSYFFSGLALSNNASVVVVTSIYSPNFIDTKTKNNRPGSPTPYNFGEARISPNGNYCVTTPTIHPLEKHPLTAQLHFPTTWFFRLQVGVAILVVVGILDF